MKPIKRVCVSKFNNKQQKMKTSIYIFLGGISLSFASFAGEGGKITKSEYVNQWKDVAIQEMIEHGIPASITLAQGILESGSGNSHLALHGNNHFGIKCHDWTGKTIFLDDDKEDECFRVYNNADESFRDHSDFLVRYSRYSFLFDYEVTDYKSWAKGLKEAGYATNPKYPNLLISIIEEMDLSQFDALGTIQPVQLVSVEGANNSTEINYRTVGSHKIYQHSQKVKYVIATNGDTYYRIAKEFGLNLRQLYKYNSFEEQKDFLEPGDVVYIQPKRKANWIKEDVVVLQETLSSKEISQKYAVNEKTILKLNTLSSGDTVLKGEKVILR